MPEVHPYAFSDLQNSVTFYELDQTSVNAEIQRYTRTGNKKTPYEDWSMVMTSKEIGFPEIRKQQVVIPGRDGVLDLTDSITGDVVYGNRKVSMSFDMIGDKNTWADTLGEIADFLHGKYVAFAFQTEQRFVRPGGMYEYHGPFGFDTKFYYGRGEINPFQTDKAVGKVVIDFDCDPFRCDDGERYILTSGPVASSITIEGTEGVTRRLIHASAKSTSVHGWLEINNSENRVYLFPNREVAIDLPLTTNTLTFTPDSYVISGFENTVYIYYKAGVL